MVASLVWWMSDTSPGGKSCGEASVWWSGGEKAPDIKGLLRTHSYVIQRSRRIPESADDSTFEFFRQAQDDKILGEVRLDSGLRRFFVQVENCQVLIGINANVTCDGQTFLHDVAR